MSIAPFTNLSDVLETTAHRIPTNEAVVFNDLRWSWHEFNQRVNNLACAFLALGIERGDRIGVVSTTRPEYLCVYMAAARIGAVMVGFNVQFTNQEFTLLADRVTPKIAVIIDQVKGEPYAERLIPVVRGLGYVQTIMIIGTTAIDGCYAVDRLMVTERQDMVDALERRKSEVDADDGALLVFTSGSTGTPKGAVLTHRSILSTILVQAREFGYRQGDRVLFNKPMNHVGGTCNLVLPSIHAGATLIFAERFHPVKALEIIQSERVTILGQVPTMFIMELNLPDFEQYDLSSVRLAIVGGASTPVAIMERMMSCFEVVMTGYGMTETGGYITYTHPEDDLKTIATTAGRIAPEFELRIVDDERKALGAGQTGEVALRGDCLLKEYFRDPAATNEAKDSQGWFYTGDIGYLNDDGYLTLVDRKKQMYISGGFNVYPLEIELYINRHPSVELAAVFGIEDDIWGEVGVACVTAKNGYPLMPEDVMRFCREGLAKYKLPKYILILESLPLTPLGKIDKPRLRRELMTNGKLTD